MDSNGVIYSESLSMALTTSKPSNYNEAITIVISNLMQEFQYIISDSINFKLQPFISHYKLLFTHPRTNNVVYTLYLICMQNILSIQASVTFENNLKSRCMLQISPENYIYFNDINEVTYKSSLIYELACKFKDSISRPLLQSVLKEKSLPELPDLSNMIYEIQINIMKYLSLKDLFNLSLVNSHWNQLTKNPYIWRHKYLSRYAKNNDMKIEQDWYQIYKKKYINEKEISQFFNHHGRIMARNEQIIRPPFHDWWQPPVDPSNINFPEIVPRLPFIGGHEDLFPHLPSQPDILMNNLNGDFEIGRLINSTLYSPFIYRSNLH